MKIVHLKETAKAMKDILENTNDCELSFEIHYVSTGEKCDMGITLHDVDLPYKKGSEALVQKFEVLIDIVHKEMSKVDKNEYQGFIVSYLVIEPPQEEEKLFLLYTDMNTREYEEYCETLELQPVLWKIAIKTSDSYNGITCFFNTKINLDGIMVLNSKK